MGAGSQGVPRLGHTAALDGLQLRARGWSRAWAGGLTTQSCMQEPSSTDDERDSELDDSDQDEDGDEQGDPDLAFLYALKSHKNTAISGSRARTVSCLLPWLFCCARAH